MVLLSTGRLIRNLIREMGYSQSEAAKIIGYSEKHLSQIINGSAGVSLPFLEPLCERILKGFRPNYFMEYDRKYKAYLAKENRKISRESYFAWADKFSLKKLFAGKSISEADQVNLLKQSLGIDCLSEYDSRFQILHQAAFLMDSSKYGLANQDLLNAYLEILVHQYHESDADALNYAGNTVLESSLNRYRPLLASDSPDEVLDAMFQICKAAGVNLILSRSVPSTYVRGAVFSENRLVYILLTERYKSLEYFTFAFIHECGHLLRGDVTPQETMVLFNLDDGDSNEDSECEINHWARRFFISDLFYSRAKACKNSLRELQRIAEESGTTVGMITSFLKHDKLLPYASLSQFSHHIAFCENDPRVVW